MTLADLLQSGRLQRHRTFAQEIADLRSLVERGLADAPVEAISSDLRFSAAYNAALSLATIPLHCAGYRTKGAGHHLTTFQALPLVMGEDLTDLANYFDVCRHKRNQVEYRRSGEVSAEEIEEIIESVTAFRDQVEDWLRANHPEFALQERS